MAEAQKKTALDPIPYGAGIGWRSAIHPQAGSGGTPTLDGSTDDGAALEGFAATVGYDLPGQTAYIGADRTFVATFRVAPGFMLVVDSGAKVTFAGGVVAPPGLHWIDVSLGGEVEFSPGSVDWISVAWFGADPAGSSRSEDEIEATWACARQNAAEQVAATVLWPGGTYRVDGLDGDDNSWVHNVALGTVIIAGMDSSVKKRILDIDGGTADPDRMVGMSFSRGFSIQAAVSGYEYGSYVSNVTGSEFYHDTSGSFTIASAYFDSGWHNNVHGYHANALTGASAYAVKCGTASWNNNTMLLRTSGSGPTEQIVCLDLAGKGNKVHIDASFALAGVDVTNVEGGSLSLVYVENVLNNIITGAAGPCKALKISGFMEVITNGTAIKAGDGIGSDGIEIGPLRVRGLSGGSNRTFLDYGTQAYRLTYHNIVDDDIDTFETGTNHGAGGGFDQIGKYPMHAAEFPPTQIPSANRYALDDYDDGPPSGTPWTPVLTFATPGDLAVTYDTQRGTYTKVGDTVYAHATIITSAFTHTTAAGVLRLSGLPFASKNDVGAQAVGTPLWGGITKAGYSQVGFIVTPNSQVADLYASGSGQALATVQAADVPSGGTVTLYLTLVYKAAN